MRLELVEAEKLARELVDKEKREQDEQKRLEEEANENFARKLEDKEKRDQDEEMRLKLVEAKKNPVADLSNPETQSLIQELRRDGNTEEDISVALGLLHRYKYLKYKTKYLTLKKNTNLLYK